MPRLRLTQGPRAGQPIHMHWRTKTLCSDRSVPKDNWRTGLRDQPKAYEFGGINPGNARTGGVGWKRSEQQYADCCATNEVMRRLHNPTRAKVALAGLDPSNSPMASSAHTAAAVWS